MSIADDVRKYIAANPGCTNPQIAEALGIPQGNLATRTSQDHKAGKLRREVHHVMPNGREVYRYYANTGVQPTKPVAPKAKKPALVLQNEEGMGALVDQLASALASQIVASLKGKIASQMQAMLPQLTAPRPMPLAPQEYIAAPRMKKVLVVGLLPQQAGMIAQEFGECLDLRFFEGGNPSRLTEQGASVDLIVSHINHSRHAYEETIKQLSVPYLRVTGGMSSLRDTLTKIYVESNDA